MEGEGLRKWSKRKRRGMEEGSREVRDICIDTHRERKKEGGGTEESGRHAPHCNTLKHCATHCNTLQHTATQCNTLQQSASNCNTLQHTATHYNKL